MCPYAYALLDGDITLKSIYSFCLNQIDIKNLHIFLFQTCSSAKVTVCRSNSTAAVPRKFPAPSTKIDKVGFIYMKF